MKNIHVLPTDKPSRLYLGDNGNFVFGMIQTSIQSKNDDFTNQNIYITSDDKFVRDEYVTDGIEVIKASPKLVDAQSLIGRRDWKKIILTTDFRLAPDVQAIDNDFLKWFVNNPNCNEVETETFEVEDYVGFAGHTAYPTFHNEYKIIIPIETQDDIVKNYLGDELKKYENVKTIIFNKPEEPKQETLEEVAERLYPENWESIMDGQHDSNSYQRNAFIKGAKWQQERSCSEEEVMNMFHNLSMHLPLHYEFLVKEQFKKK